MIIDFHTHTFPKEIAKRALSSLSEAETLKPFTLGTNEDLVRSMDEAGVDVSILLPVVTRLNQTEDINAAAVEVEKQTGGRLLSFGGIHPEDEDYKKHLDMLKAGGLKGIKLHPVFQKTYFDDIRYKRIIDRAGELDMIVMVHAGSDIAVPDSDFVSAGRIISLVREVRPDKLILAHMGAWRNWEEAEQVCGECSGIYVDTAFVLSADGNKCFYNTGIRAMEPERFLRIVRQIGAERVLFGTDSPWTDQLQSISAIRQCGLSEEECTLILGENAERLLKLRKK